MLLFESLADNEAAFFFGSERFSKYTGYGYEFKWNGDVQDMTETYILF